MSNQAKIKTKLVAVGYAPILSETKDKTTYGNPVYFAAAEAGGREYSISPVGEVKKSICKLSASICLRAKWWV